LADPIHQAALAASEQMPVEILPASNEAMLSAAHIKANYPVAYADAFVIAAAQEFNATVLTGDPEFQALTGQISIEMLYRQAKWSTHLSCAITRSIFALTSFLTKI
jgi:predicted nucleic acid-binding protein